MKAIKKIYQHNIDLILPLVAVLLGAALLLSRRMLARSR